MISVLLLVSACDIIQINSYKQVDNKITGNETIGPRCGDGMCDESEDFFTCSSDCPLYINVENAWHSIIPSINEVVVERINVTHRLSKQHDNFVDSSTYIEIPTDHPKNPYKHTVNARDRLDISFKINDEIFSVLSNKSTTLELYMACGNYGQLLIETPDRFGGAAVLETIECEQNWKEVHTSIPITHLSPIINVTMRTHGRGGSSKIDFARLKIS